MKNREPQYVWINGSIGRNYIWLVYWSDCTRRATPGMEILGGFVLKRDAVNFKKNWKRSKDNPGYGRVYIKRLYLQ